tara:strand:- start:2543 stop:2809 length:267 start_codon:yes stop_codon:yes gene_type:complete
MNKKKYLRVETPVDHTEGTRIRNAEIDLARKVEQDSKKFVRAAQLEIKELEAFPVPTFVYEQIEVTEDHPDYEEAAVIPYFGVPMKKN